MTKQGARMTLLALSAVTVVGVGLYLSYKQRLPAGAPDDGVAPSTADVADPTTAERVGDGWARPRMGAIRKKLQGVAGTVADVQKRVTGEGSQVVARYRLGHEGRRLTDVPPT